MVLNTRNSYKSSFRSNRRRGYVTNTTHGSTVPGDLAENCPLAVADVDALVKDGSAIDEHARHNTTSVYTAAQFFSIIYRARVRNQAKLAYNAVNGR